MLAALSLRAALLQTLAPMSARPEPLVGEEGPPQPQPREPPQLLHRVSRRRSSRRVWGTLQERALIFLLAMMFGWQLAQSMTVCPAWRTNVAGLPPSRLETQSTVWMLLASLSLLILAAFATSLAVEPGLKKEEQVLSGAIPAKTEEPFHQIRGNDGKEETDQSQAMDSGGHFLHKENSLSFAMSGFVTKSLAVRTKLNHIHWEVTLPAMLPCVAPLLGFLCATVAHVLEVAVHKPRLFL